MGTGTRGSWRMVAGAMAAATLVFGPGMLGAGPLAGAGAVPSLGLGDPDGGTLDPGDAIRVELTDGAPGASYRVALCNAAAVIIGVDTLDSTTCSPPLGLTADEAGRATTMFPLTGLPITPLRRFCESGPGESGPCAVVAFGDDGSAVATASVAFGPAGSGSVDASLVDTADGTTPAGLLAGAAELCLLDPGGEDCTYLPFTDPTSITGAGLPAGTYRLTVDAWIGGTAYERQAVRFSASAGERVPVVVPLNRVGSSAGPLGTAGAAVALEPVAPRWNDPIVVTASGLSANAAVSVGLCADPRALVAVVERESPGCRGGIAAVADGDGRVVVTIPMAEDRFTNGNCSLESCRAFVVEPAAARGAWRAVPFIVPAGDASLAGEVRATPARRATFPVTVEACGSVGCATATGTPFSIGGLPDGTYRVRAWGVDDGGRFLISEFQDVTIRKGRSVTNIRIVLEPRQR